MGFKYIIGIPERQLQVFPLGRRWGVISSVSIPVRVEPLDGAADGSREAEALAVPQRPCGEGNELRLADAAGGLGVSVYAVSGYKISFAGFNHAVDIFLVVLVARERNLCMIVRN